MSGQRKALIVAVDEYDHESLGRLLAPAADAAALAKVLGDPQIGDFGVQVVRNQPAHVIQAQIEDFLSDSRPDDVLLLHFSCHGLKSESGELFFAARNTLPNRLASTAIPADFVQRCLRASRSRSIVLLLDCCYGGAFSQGVIVRAAGNINVLDSFTGAKLGGGRGRAVITASSAMEYAFEGERLTGDHTPRPSVFTKALVDGLATGDADFDEDGRISLDELYEYVFDKVQEQNPHQTPGRDFELQGELYVAHSPRRHIHAAPLPPDLEAARKDQNMYTRRGAVRELRSRLLSDNLPAAAGAWEALTEMANDVSYVADEACAALHEAAVHPAETELNFGQLVQGSPSPHQTVHLLGPPIAHYCTPDASHEWIHIKETAEGFDVSVDTVQAGMLKGCLSIKGRTGAAVLTIRADFLAVSNETPVSQPAAGEVSASALAPSHMPEAPPTAPSALQPMPSAPPGPQAEPRLTAQLDIQQMPTAAVTDAQSPTAPDQRRWQSPDVPSIPHVKESLASPSSEPKPPKLSDTHMTPGPQRRRRWYWIGVAAAVVIAVISTVIAVGRNHPSSVPSYGEYTNSRYGFTTLYPSSLKAQPPPQDGRGQAWASSDGQVLFSAYGVDNVHNYSPQQDEVADSQGLYVTYHDISGNIVTVSGYKNSGRTIVYQRDVVGPGAIDTLYWSYPASEKAEWYTAVTQIAYAFLPGDISNGHGTS